MTGMIQKVPSLQSLLKRKMSEIGQRFYVNKYQKTKIH